MTSPLGHRLPDRGEGNEVDGRRLTLVFDSYGDYCAALANALSGRFELTIVAPAKWRDWIAPVLDGSIRQMWVDLPRLRDPNRIRAVGRVVRAIESSAADLVHVQQLGDPLLNLSLARHRFDVPVVHTIHDVRPHPGDRRQLWLATRTQRRAARDAGRVITHAETLADGLETTWLLDRRTVSVIPHGELGSLYRSRVGPRDRTAREPRTLLFFGRRWAYKGLDVLADSLARIAADTPDLRFIVAGTGERLNRRVRSLSDILDLEIIDRHTSPVETTRLFDRASAVVLPYVEASQSGVAALALGLGTPIVATSVGGLGEVLDDDTTALLVPPRDVDALARAIRRLLDDAELCRRLSRNGLELASGELSWSAIAEQTHRVYSSVLVEPR